MQLNFNEKLATRLQVQDQFPETTEYKDFVREIVRLRLKIQELEKQNSDYSWQTNPDRMGGGWTADELDPNRGWK